MRTALAVVLASCAIGCATAVSDEDLAALKAEDDVQTKSSAIINGATLTANSFNVAVWHWHNDLDNWFPRPCSGTVLRRTSTQTIVLTARHCVTRDGSYNGSLLAVSKLRVTTALNPGTRASTVANTVTPSGTAPSSIRDFKAVATSTNPSAHDAVLLYVDSVLAPVNSTTPSHGRIGMIGLHRGPISELVGKSQRAYGYGRNVEGTSTQMGDPYWAGGAGTLRTAPGLEVIDGDVSTYTNNYRTGFYDYINNPDVAAAIVSGDSGGGSYLPYVGASAVTLWMVLTGVHSSAWLDYGSSPYQGMNTAVTALSDWIQVQLRWLSLSPARYPQYRVYPSSLAEDATVRWTTTTSTAGLYYHGASKQIRVASDTGVTSFCLHDTGSGWVRLRTCTANTPAQRWTMLSNYRIRNDSTLKCLSQPNHGAVLGASCTTDPTIQFVWSTVP